MNRVCSIFSQVLQLIPRAGFDRAGREAPSRAACAWFQQLGTVRRDAVLSAGRGQVAARDLRRAAASEGKLRHLGLPQAPARSTLAYANEPSSVAVVRKLFQQFLRNAARVGGSNGGATQVASNTNC